MEINFIFQLVIIMVSIVFHELSHGYAAYFLGDPTAKYAGRLTLNPIKHLEIFGSVIVPILSYMLGGIVFGWAKPVPYNPYNLRMKRYGEVVVALAGPASNLLIAGFFALYFRLANLSLEAGGQATLVILIVIVNITLAIFNLMPIPPLDGFKILWGIVPYRFHFIKEFIERNMLVFLLLFIIFFSYLIDPIIFWIFKLLTGLNGF